MSVIPKHRAPGTAVAGLLAAVVLCPISSGAAEGITKTWAMAEFGEPLYKDGFEHWPYVNPNAPKGGKVVLGAFGTYDNFNTIILKGEFPGSIGHIGDSLMVGSGDELMSAYGQIAETAEYPEDKSWVIFNLRPEARYTDGVAITAEDFKFAFETYKEHGRPLIRSFIADIERCEVLSDYRVKYTMRTRNSMKPLMVAAGFSPLPRHFWLEQDITKTSVTPPPGSGAYRISASEPGRFIVYERLKDYWGADLPVNRGLENFDEIQYDYYRDDTVQFEAFKAGKIDFRGENSAKRWVTGYDSPKVKNGEIILKTHPNETPRGISAFFFNLRQPQFKDARVREAIGYFYDFEAIQRTLLFGKYRRVESYFPNSDYGASGPPSAAELAVLEPFRDQLPPQVLSEPFTLPKTDGSGRIRANQRKALALLKEAGWEPKDGKMVHRESGEQLTVELMTASPETRRISLPFVENLRRAGIDGKIRFMDVAQWRNSIEQKDFDVYSARNNFFPPPGTELRIYFGSQVEGDPGTGNRMGYSNPVADALIEQIVTAKDLDTLKATTRALDRVLLWNYNVVPQFYPDEQWLAYWNKFGHPEIKPRYNSGFPGTWWLDETLALNVTTQ
jgi:microcin C transport system substrate-binding protein